jgi:hypothetical protein
LRIIGFLQCASKPFAVSSSLMALHQLLAAPPR